MNELLLVLQDTTCTGTSEVSEARKIDTHEALVLVASSVPTTDLQQSGR